MAMQKLIFAVLIIQWVNGAPSDIKLEDIADVKQAEDKAEVKPNTLLEENPSDEASQGQRQKRWYNYYGFPPFSPTGFSRDDTLGPGAFGAQDPLAHIHRRLQEINNIVRQPPIPQFPPPLPPQFPAFIPIIYIPQVGCSCTPDDTTQNPNDRPAPPQGNQNTTDNPGVFNRWPEMEDERQNWGIVMNGTEPDEPVEDDGDGSRPISFDPIKPVRPTNRPPPPVEHGSSEGDVNGGTTTTTTSRPAQAPAAGFPGPPGLAPPSACDGAILSCCHQPQVTYDCFALQGCPDPSAYGNPCDSGVIFRVIDRFQRFYGQRNG